MPRKEKTKPPGPFTAAAQVPLVEWRFDANNRRELAAHLSRQLHNRALKPDIFAKFREYGLPEYESVADWIINETEAGLVKLKSVLEIDRHAADPNVANYRAAIRDLRDALEPFVKGYVDAETAALAPWGEIDNVLLKRCEQLKAMKSRPYSIRRLQRVCAGIGKSIWQISGNTGANLTDKEIATFIALSLDLANIEHFEIEGHLDRWVAFVFPPL